MHRRIHEPIFQAESHSLPSTHPSGIQISPPNVVARDHTAPQQDTITIPRAIADDPFLVHFHDDTTTASLKCDEILDHLSPSSAPDPPTQRTPLYGYRDFSYASGNNATIGTYKVPLVHNLKRLPPTKQRVLPSKEQRVLDQLVQQTQPIKRRRTSGSNTTTLKANKRVNTPDINTHSHQPTARLTWEDERVSGPVLNLKIDGDQSFQTNAGKWAQSEATEINSLIQSGAFSPVYDGPAQSELNKSSRHINIRFHALRTEADFEADFLTKPLPTLLYEQLRSDMDANENYSN